MEYEITGKIVEVYPVIRVNERFRKREFVIEHKSNIGGQAVIDFIKFQLTQEKCDSVDESWLKDEVMVRFSIRGNRWEKNGAVNYITNLNALTVARGQTAGDDGQQNIRNIRLEDAPPPDDEFGELPF
jgi:hypothetical protein